MFVSTQESTELHLPHEQVVVRNDRQSGLSAVIAVHNTQLGAAAGGCRRWSYVSTDAAVEDALRLSEGMTYKNALAGIPFGGGKSVIIAEPGSAAPSPEQLQVFGQWLNELQGRYITAEDVGMGIEQMRVLAQYTNFAAGLGHRGVGGDPSPKTAYGVFLGLQTAVAHAFGSASLQGRHVAVQGLGAVGMALCQYLVEAGARLTVADINSDRVSQAVAQFDAATVPVQEIAQVPADVFAPCALGGVLDESTIAQLQVRVVAGAANNQLANDACGDLLQMRGIVYAPDFVINAAGVISVGQECLLRNNYFAYCDTHSLQRWVDVRIQGIAHRLQKIFDIAQAQGCNTDLAARKLAIEVLDGQCAGQPHGVAAA